MRPHDLGFRFSVKRKVGQEFVVKMMHDTLLIPSYLLCDSKGHTVQPHEIDEMMK